MYERPLRPGGDYLCRDHSMQPATLRRLSSCDEDLGPPFKAFRRREFARFGIDLGSYDPAGCCESVDVFILASLVGTLHELGPDRQRAPGARQLEIAIIV